MLYPCSFSMNLRSVSVGWTTLPSSQFFCSCKVDRDGYGSNRNKGFVQTRAFNGFHVSYRDCYCDRKLCRRCRYSSSSVNPVYLNPLFGNSGRCSVKALVYKQLPDIIHYEGFASKESIKMSSNFISLQEDPIMDKLRTQIGVIHPTPLPPISGQIAGMLMLFFLVGIVFDKLWTSIDKNRVPPHGHGLSSMPQGPTSFFLPSENELQRKESVEWVNMVLAKLWRVYTTGIENWVVSSLEPVIEDLEKPNYVEGIEIKQFTLGEGPFVVRTVERITSRRADDLQYQIGIRYTGGAHFLLVLSLKYGIGPIMLPVRVHDFDIDGEVWVKLQLMPSEPWVQVVSWAFVSLPKIKFELSIFRLINLMTIPVLSKFLRKLLTEDVPRNFVLPNKIVLDLGEGTKGFPVSNDSGSGEFQEGGKDFVGELSVTLVDAQQLPCAFYGKNDPYVVLRLGDQVTRSKRNTQTSFTGPPGAPIWNQDFHLLVENPRKQKLIIQVKDSLGFADLVIGSGEIELGSLEDTVPTDVILVLQGGWGLFKKGSSGEILLRLTYKPCVDDEEDDGAKVDLMDDELSNDEQKSTYERSQRASNPTCNGSFMDELANLLVSEEFQRLISFDPVSAKASHYYSNIKSIIHAPRNPISNSKSSSESSDSPIGSALFWFGIFTVIVALVALSVGGSSLFNP